MATTSTPILRPPPVLQAQPLRGPAWQQKIFSALQYAGDGLERKEAVCYFLLVLTFLPLAVLMARSQRLWGDEVYTLRIAQQPTWSAMFRLSRQIDLHPPLHYVLQRFALATHLPLMIATRLPSMIAGQITLLAIFKFISRRLGNVQGMLGAAIFWFSPALDFSWCNRPYGLWFCLLALTALFWDKCIDRERRWWAPLAMGAAALAMVMNDMFGLVCLLPFFLAEVVRWYRTRRIDWLVAVALVVPSLAGLLYMHQISTFSTNTFAAGFLPSFGMGVDVYVELLCRAVSVLAACVAVTVVVLHGRWTERDQPLRLRDGELAMIVALCAMPAVLMVLAKLHNTQFFARYGCCGAVGFALLTPFAMTRYSQWARAVGLYMVLAMVVASAVRSEADTYAYYGPWRAAAAQGVPPKHLETLDPSLPIAVAGATEFTELNVREPVEVARRLVYVTDRANAQRYSGQTIFETEEETAPLLGLPGRGEPLAHFLQEHSRFYLVAGYTDIEQWFMRYLMANGAEIQYAGKFASTVADDDLYVVTMPKK